jgi:hypothetical protein
MKNANLILIGLEKEIENQINLKGLKFIYYCALAATKTDFNLWDLGSESC